MRSLDGPSSPDAEGRPSKRLRLEDAQDGLYFPQVVKDLEEGENAGMYTLDILKSGDTASKPPLEVEACFRTPRVSSDWDMDDIGGLEDDLDKSFRAIFEPTAHYIFDDYNFTTLNEGVEDLEQSRELIPPPLMSTESSLDFSPDSTLTPSQNGAERLHCEDVIIRRNDELDLEEDNTLDSKTGTENSTQSEIVCFGMITGIPLKVLNSVASQPETLFPVSLLGPRMLLRDDDSSPYATLHEQSAETLRALEIKASADLQMFCEITKMSTKVPRVKSYKKKDNGGELQRSSNLYVVVYGPLAKSGFAGRFLQRHGVYLQDPLFGSRIAKYYNPHRFCQLDDDHPIVNAKSSPKKFGALETPLNPFIALENGDDLPETAEPPGLAINLFSHQKQALSFLIRREQGWALDTPAADIWKKARLSNGRDGYVNTITGVQQLFKPPEFHGGILADPMGLGKSMSMISLVLQNPLHLSNDKSSHGVSKGTLLVVPLNVLATWEAQLDRHLYKDAMSYYRYHGSQRKPDLLAEHDVIITTYHTIASEWKRERRNVRTVFTLHWHRVIIDEAHVIRDPSTSISKAVRSLCATHRWAVTGTPIQNRLEDLSSVFQFLQVYPYSNPKIFDEQISGPWRRGDPEAVNRLRAVIRCIALRRPKAVIELPDRVDKVQEVAFNEQEEQMYENVKASATSFLNDAISTHASDNKSYLNALQRINSLRMICNLGAVYRGHSKTFQPENSWDERSAQRAFENVESVGAAICFCCSLDLGLGPLGPSGLSESVHRIYLSKCLRLFCSDCFGSFRKKAHGRGAICGCVSECPSFQVASNSTGSSASPPSSSQLGHSPQTSSKITTLVGSLKEENTCEKSVVFSFWTTTLDVIALAIDNSIKYVQFDGRSSAAERNAAMRTFQDDSDVRVMLISLSCGAVGLDLTAASRIYLMEPQWNPMLEEQALDRVHRIGQTKPVTIIRYIVKDSIEENIRIMQARKRHLADLSLSQSCLEDAAPSESRLEYLRSLVS